MSRAELRLCCFFYLSRVRCAWVFILAVIDMISKWSSLLESTRPPDESTQFVLVGPRRVFASSTNTCFLSGRRLCSSHHSHPGCFCGELVEAVSEAFFGWELWLSPPPHGFWRDGIIFVEKHIRERSRCKKRICDVLDPSISSYNKPFPPWMYLDYSLLGVTSFVSLYQPLGCPLCSWDWVVSSGEMSRSV